MPPVSLQLAISQNPEELCGHADLGVSVAQVPAVDNGISLYLGHSALLSLISWCLLRISYKFLTKGENLRKKVMGIGKKLLSPSTMTHSPTATVDTKN